MWQATIRSKPSPWQKSLVTAYRFASTQPPPPRPFNPAVSKRVPSQLEEPPQSPAKKSILSRIWPFSRPQAPAKPIEPRDPARGVAAAQRVVREGVLDDRYKAAAGRITALICALPIAIYLSYELWRRRFMGVERKQIPPAKSKVEVMEGG